MATRITVHASPLLLERGVRGTTGQPMEIVVHLPTAPALSAHGFELDSAFPGAALVGSVPELARVASEQPERRLVLFGHADEAGSEAHNKRLSDRRAQAMLALLTQDLSMFDAVAREDEWKLIQYQAMLAALGVGPLDVDGKPGPRTTKGVKSFQRAYNAGEYHEHALRERAHAALKVDGALGARTEAALRDAYLAQVTAKVDAARFIGPKTAGCCEFNSSGAAESDRRVVLALYRPEFPTEGKIPCKQGDAAACKLNKRAPHAWKCNFYRRTLEAETPVESVPFPARARVLAQTVDELGYRLGHQPLVFVDEVGTQTHVTTDDHGVYDGFLVVRGQRLALQLPDGSSQPVWEARVDHPAIVDVMVRGGSTNGPAETLRQHALTLSVYDRTNRIVAREGRFTAGDIAGEPWAEISVRGEERQ